MANNEAEVPEVEDKYAELREHYASGEALTDVEIDTIADIAVGHVRGILTFFGEEGASIDEYEGDDGELILDITGGDLAVLEGEAVVADLGKLVEHCEVLGGQDVALCRRELEVSYRLLYVPPHVPVLEHIAHHVLGGNVAEPSRLLVASHGLAKVLGKTSGRAEVQMPELYHGANVPAVRRLLQVVARSREVGRGRVHMVSRGVEHSHPVVPVNRHWVHREVCRLGLIEHPVGLVEARELEPRDDVAGAYDSLVVALDGLEVVVAPETHLAHEGLLCGGVGDGLGERVVLECPLVVLAPWGALALVVHAGDEQVGDVA